MATRVMATFSNLSDISGLPSQPVDPQSTANEYDDKDRILHETFMREALAMAELALATDETPVGCILVHDNEIIARGMNATNRTLNGTRHAEFMAISSILSPQAPSSALPTSAVPGTEGKISPTAILKKSVLYVTVEPCIMCAALLRQYGIRKVFYGATNDRFGGTGGVLSIHSDEGVNAGYEVSGGWLREEAILLLRRFYVQQNEKAPEPRNKKERVLKTEIEPLVTISGDISL